MTQRGPSIIARIAFGACLSLAAPALHANEIPAQPEKAAGNAQDADVSDRRAERVAPPSTQAAPLNSIGDKAQAKAQNHERADKKNEEPSKSSSRFDQFFEVKLTDLLIAVFTFALAVFTYLLWRSTDKLWAAGEEQRRLSERTAERQLRAYVSAMQARVFFGESSLRVQVHAKNFGQTPAYNVSQMSGVEISILPLEPDFIRQGERPKDRSGSIGPGGENGFILPLRDIPADRLDMAKKGQLPVVAWGTIWYDDAFGNERRTSYRFVYEGTQTDPPGLMRLGWKGNEET